MSNVAGTFVQKTSTEDASRGTVNKSSSAPHSPVRIRRIDRVEFHTPETHKLFALLPATDLNPIESIMQRVEVVDLDTYKRMAASSKNKRSDALHYNRFSYDTKSRVPKESEVRNTPTFCICKQPENPDRLMVCCERCNAWFHGGAAHGLFGERLARFH